jgi:hypothetical protein
VAKIAFVDSRIQEQYGKGIDGLLSRDEKPSHKPINSIFNKYPLRHKILQWLRLVSFA